MTTTKHLLLFLVALLPIAQGRLSGRVDGETERDLTTDGEEMINVVVGYSNEERSTFQAHEGRRYLSKFNVLSRLKRVNAISMRIRASEVYMLEQDPDVTYVEEDIKMYPLSDPTPGGVERTGNKVLGGERDEELLPHQELRSLQERNRNRNRKREKRKRKNGDGNSISKVNDEQPPEKGEDIPWGISAVQGGNVPIPKPINSTGCFKICIIDTGLRVEHPDIPFVRGDGKIRGKGFGLPTGQSWYNPSPSANHGTHVTGIVIAAGNNGIGVEGVISNSENFCMMHARVFGDNISAGQYVSVIDGAVEWCADGGARVINMSLGYAKDLKASKELYKKLTKEGILVISAAGNRGISRYEFPASYSDVLSVAAVDKDLRRAHFSNFNDQVDITAPGEDIYSTVMNSNPISSGLSVSYEKKSGTSMASPHVAGVAAKIWAAKPNCSNVEVREALEKTAVDLGKAGRDDYYGHGMVQAVPAYRYLDNLGC